MNHPCDSFGHMTRGVRNTSTPPHLSCHTCRHCKACVGWLGSRQLDFPVLSPDHGGTQVKIFDNQNFVGSARFWVHFGLQEIEDLPLLQRQSHFEVVHDQGQEVA